jgi:hypothetical protein
MGGILGVAVFLSVVYSTVSGKIRGAYASAASDPAFQAAAAAHPDQLATLRSGGSSTLNDTSFLSHFDPTLAHPFKAGFTSALTIAFLVAAGVLATALILAILQREVPLRTMSAQQAVLAEAEAESRAARGLVPGAGESPLSVPAAPADEAPVPAGGDDSPGPAEAVGSGTRAPSH